MEDYRLDQSGQEVQDILDGAAMQSDLTAETERAELAEQTLQGNIDIEERDRKAADLTLQGNIDAEELRAKAAEKQNADDIDALEEKVPSGASSSNKLATESYVDDSVATATATFRGTYNLVSDLNLTVDATEQQIATALALDISTADNNDYCFVQVPTSSETPTEIKEIDRYKFNGTAWSFEYKLNNSGFTAAQWAAINSGITSGDVTKLAALPTNAELTTLLNGKQDVLTFDNVPTEGSSHPVKSGGVYSAIDDEKTARENADSSLSSAIEAILLLIPSAATSLNKLADKAFVNSSIATASATFRGTYNLVTDLSLTVSATHAQIATALAGAVSDEDNNDYAFVQIPTADATPTQIAKTERYKYNGTAWEYEYDLNNSGYTAAQWAAINSGITEALVTKLSALPTNAELTSALGVLTSSITTINQKIPSAASQANQLVDTAAMESYIVQVLDVLTASFNVTSTDGHVTVSISQVDGKITSVAVSTSDIASASDLSLIAGRVTTAEGNISTNATDIANLQAAYAALTQSDIVVVSGALPSSGQQQNIIYRQPDQDHTPPQFYSDYMWNGTAWVLMATYNNAIDPRPKKGSQNLVTSGGVFDNMGALDVSELNATENPHTIKPYATLDAALADIPSDYQKGGMSIKYVQTSDNKYIQARCMAQNFTTDVTQWQGVDDEPTAGSDNLVKSGGVVKQAQFHEVNESRRLFGIVQNYSDFFVYEHGTLSNSGEPVYPINRARVRTVDYFPVNSGCDLKLSIGAGYAYYVCEFDKNLRIVRWSTLKTNTTLGSYSLASTTAFIKILIQPNPDDASAVIDLDDFPSNLHLEMGVDNNLLFAKLPKMAITEDRDSLFNSDDIEIGSIGNSGEDVVSTKHLRTSEYSVLSAHDRIFYKNIQRTWDGGIVCYDKNKSYLGYFELSDTLINKEFSIYSLSTNSNLYETRFVRFYFRYRANSYSNDITNEIKRTFDIAFYRIPFYDEKQRLSIEMLSLDNNIALPYWVYKNAEEQNTDYRLVSEFCIPLKSNCSYRIKKVHSYNATERISIELYDADKNHLRSIGWLNENITFRTTNEAFAKLLYKYDDTTNKIPEEVVPGYIFQELDEPSINSDIIISSASYWQNGSTDGDGQPIDSSIRLLSGFVSLSDVNVLHITINDGWAVGVELYDENYGHLHWDNYYEGNSDVKHDYDAKYARFIVRHGDDTISPSDLSSAGLSITTPLIGVGKVKHLRVAQWNCGGYNEGVSPSGIPNAQLQEKLMEIRNLITNLHADILLINEEVDYIDRDQTMTPYDAVYKQFYPFKAKSGWYMSIYSKYPIATGFITLTSDNRAAIVGEVDVDGERIGFIGVHFSPYTSAGRISDAEESVDIMDTFNKCVLVGDLNTGSQGEEYASAEMQPFVTKGYSLGNRGYWGSKVTYPTGSYKIDNIITKNININCFEVIEETSVSDHYPVYSDISFL